jgi:hypothetical protein
MENPQNPDYGWKPNNRPQSTVAQNFMSELDDLFKIDGGLDDLDKNVHQKKQEVTSHAQQLEELEARLRATEERLKVAKSSPPSRKTSPARPAIPGDFPDDAQARIGEAASPLAARTRAAPSVRGARDMPDRPPSARTQDGERA